MSEQRPYDDDYAEATAVLRLSDLGSAPPLSATERHVLIRLEGSDVGRVIGLGREECMVGRRPEMAVCLNYEGVSRKHARIYPDGGMYFVEDLGSSNGTFVNGERKVLHRLANGDILHFGPSASVRYSVTDSHEENMLRHLYEASIRDALTGAYKRAYLFERLKAEIAFTQRHRTETALIMFDLDHFKNVNDTYGHQAGDAVLVTVASRVMENLRTEDVFARYGGEEFAVSLRDTTLEDTARLAERIRKYNDTHLDYHGTPIKVSISVGCANLADCEQPTAEHLVAVADRRLYMAKHGGRNRVVWQG